MPNTQAIKAGRAFVEVFADDSKLKRTLRSVSGQLKNLGSSVSRIGTGMAAAGGAIVAPIAAAVGKFVSFGDQMDKMSQRTGVSVEALSQLKFAAEQSGSSVEGLEAGIKGMQKMVLNAQRGLSTATDTLDDLGLSMDDLAGKSPEDQFTILAEAVSRVSDPSRRAALAMQAFGRSGQQLLPMLNGGAQGINALRAEADRLGLTMTGEQATAAAKMADSWNRIKKVLLAAALTIGTALAPYLTALSEWIVGVVQVAAAWIKQNQGLVKIIAAVGAGILIFGTILVTIGGVITAIGTIVGAVSVVMTGFGIVMGVILSPIGLVVAAVLTLGAALAYVTGAGEKFVNWAKKEFSAMFSMPELSTPTVDNSEAKKALEELKNIKLEAPDLTAAMDANTEATIGAAEMEVTAVSGLEDTLQQSAKPDLQGSAFGTFSAFVIDRLGSAGGNNEALKAARKTAKNTELIADLLERRGPVFT